MNHYVTAVLLICATMMGQGQPAQLPVRLLEQHVSQEFGLQNALPPQRLARLRLLARVDLGSVIQAAARSIAEQCPDVRPLPLRKVQLTQYRTCYPRFLPASVLLLRGP